MGVRTIVGQVVLAGALGCGVVGFAAGSKAGEGFGGPTPGLRVPAKGLDTHSFTFRRGARVTITVRGDGDTDVDLFVYDENGRLVAKDDDLTDVCVVAFTPEETGRFRVEVKNLGNVYNEYRMEIR
jgi:hypothetical protein